jgi:hypothetical protein
MTMQSSEITRLAISSLCCYHGCKVQLFCDMEAALLDLLKIQSGMDEPAIIQRIVPGRLVYVTKQNEDPAKMYIFKLDRLIIRKSDGSCRPYRGEPLSELGLRIGGKVVVWGIEHKNVSPALVVDVDYSFSHG